MFKNYHFVKKFKSKYLIIQPPLCSGSRREFNNATYRDRVFDAVTRSLTFIDAHLDQLNTIEPAFALSVLKGYFQIYI